MHIVLREDLQAQEVVNPFSRASWDCDGHARPYRARAGRIEGRGIVKFSDHRSVDAIVVRVAVGKENRFFELKRSSPQGCHEIRVAGNCVSLAALEETLEDIG